MGTYRELAEKGKGLETVLENKEYSHGEYCHYTTLDTINKIIKGKSFMLGSANGFNDDCDRNQFENPKQSFALCFATGVSENLPMWQIYAGCNLQGGRIQFTNSVHSIEKLVKDSKFEVWRKKEYIQRFESNRTNTYVPYILKDGEMYKAFHDVIYVREEGKNVSIKYNNRFIWYGIVFRV